jgi:serine/threonine protein kinase
MGFESPLKTSESLTTFERGEELLDSYVEKVKHDLEVEIERIIAEKPMIGEGRTARVFDLELDRLHCPVCVKIWHPELENIQKENVVEYKRMQSHSPEAEFILQDKLYMRGFRHVPRPIAYGKFGPYYVMAMEKIVGFTLKELMEYNIKIGNLSWRDLEIILIDLNRNQKVAHRDLHPGNIMIETDTSPEEDSTINGELFIIDFGTSKETATMPTPEDYRLTIGKNSILYRDDKAHIDDLKPSRTGANRSPFTK